MTAIRTEALFSHPLFKVGMAVLSVLCAAPSDCGGGGGPSASDVNARDGGGALGDAGLGGGDRASPGASALSENDVDAIVRQAAHEATARGKPATIAVVDRVGNVLAVAQMAGAPTSATVTSGRGVSTGLETVSVPTTLAAISKAITGAYLSSNGNSFTTRTANQIIQEHFNPLTTNTPGGPLFGVQFSQLPCSDFSTMAAAGVGATNAGPHRSPLGFAADSGGLPIYDSRAGTLVGGIGIMTKSTYSIDADIINFDVDDDEVVAIAGVNGHTGPAAIQAQNISVGGLTLRYTDATTADLAAPVSTFGAVITPLAVPGFFAGPAPGHTAIAGTTFASADGKSGIVPDGILSATIYPGVNAYVFSDGVGNVLYKPTVGLAPVGGLAITAAEAQRLVLSALDVAFSARAQIRKPTSSFAQVTIAVVDLEGNVLAMARTPDAPVFGSDVALQKARSAVFLSRTDAAATINAIAARASTTTNTFANYIDRAKALVGATVFANGIAFSGRAIGNLSRPFYPDGIDANSAGPLSLDFATWSEFSTGLQLDLVKFDIATYGLTGAATPASGCAFGTANNELPLTASSAKTQLANGLQIFPGGVPLYRGNTLVGGIGVSGDGIDQDDMVAFLGTQNGPGTVTNAASGIRADQLSPGGTRLRYVNCPFAPFLNSSEANPC
jgi:uncharacterized protein GlcG (DUF336 family)